MQDDTNGTWDGVSCGKDRKARHEYRRQQRRFEEMGGTVHLSNLERVDSVVDGSEQCEPRLSTRVKHRQECMKQMRWFSSRRVLEGIDAKQIFFYFRPQTIRATLCRGSQKYHVLVWK